MLLPSCSNFLNFFKRSAAASSFGVNPACWRNARRSAPVLLQFFPPAPQRSRSHPDRFAKLAPRVARCEPPLLFHWACIAGKGESPALRHRASWKKIPCFFAAAAAPGSLAGNKSASTLRRKRKLHPLVHRVPASLASSAPPAVMKLYFHSTVLRFSSSPPWPKLAQRRQPRYPKSALK